MIDQDSPDLSESPTVEHAEVFRPRIEFIDDHSPSNPFNNVGHNRGITQKVFDHNGPSEEETRGIGQREAALLDLKNRGGVLEIGWGGNRFFAEGIYEAAGIPITILDSDVIDDESRSTLPENASRDNKVQFFQGKAQNLSTNPELTDRKFGSILFHGSLFGSGMNWTIEQGMESEYSKNSEDPSQADLPEFIDTNLDAVLKGAKEHLSPQGVLMITSDRFSYYGSGRKEKDIPLEKLEFLNIVSKAVTMKAKKITVIGVRTNSVKSDFADILSQVSIDQLTNGVEILPETVDSEYLTTERIKKIKQTTRGIIPSDVGMIDAIAVEF